MEVSMSVYYLGAVNVIGFLLYGIHLKLFRQRVEGQVDIPLMCLSLAGGSGGIFLSMLFFGWHLPIPAAWLHSDNTALPDRLRLRQWYQYHRRD